MKKYSPKTVGGVLGYLISLASGSTGSQPPPAPPCPHDHWTVNGYNHIGCGSCQDCKKEIPLALLFDGLRKRMEAALENRGST